VSEQDTSTSTDFLFEPVPLEKFQALTQEQLIQYIQGLQNFNEQLIHQNKKLQRRAELLEEKTLLLGEQFIVLKRNLFGKSSEKLAQPETTTGDDLDPSSESGPKKPPRKRIRLPSERYPDAPLIEEEIELKDLPACRCCGETLSDSGMTEDREFVTKIPEQFFVVRQKRHKYRCGSCHGDLQTAPAPPRIKEGSAFSDEMILDVAISKFCDLIPIERQTKMAERHGFPGLPPQSLIESTHYLAEFLKRTYELLKAETFASRVLLADETPHRMLEGDKTQNWYFWGFSGKASAYFEAHSTRSGDVAANLIKDSACEVLVSDVYSGYKKAAREANEFRAKNLRPLIQTSYCNAHARRKFKESDAFPAERDYFLQRYQRIYRLETEARDEAHPPDRLEDRLRENRLKMRPIFEEMKVQAIEWLTSFSSKSSIVRAMSYFLKNYDELILFTGRTDVPIDNNAQERLLRSPVIGRKTWYGTHSKQGARTTAILFSVIESCKLNGVNPRCYLKKLVEDLHTGRPPYTPYQFKAQEDERARSKTPSFSTASG
jgi:transposase